MAEPVETMRLTPILLRMLRAQNTKLNPSLKGVHTISAEVPTTVVVNPKSAAVELDDETLEEFSLGEDLILAIVRRIIREADEEEYDAESESMSEDEGTSRLPGKEHHY